jgi:hypothetical protein
MNGLTFTVRWSTAAAEDPALSTRGAVTLFLEDQVVWGPFEWTWVDFLEHLARVWPRLLWQPMPLNLQPDSVGAAPALVREALTRLDPDELEAAEAEGYSFLEAHDLAHGIAGARLPSVWLVVEGGRVAVATDGAFRWLPISESLGAVERWAEEIVARLRGSRHPRSIAAVQAWAERHQSIEDAAALYTGWDLEELAQLGRSVSPGVRVERSVVLALARAVRGVMPPSELKLVLDQVRSTARGRTRAVLPVFDASTDGPPFEQGFELAGRVRAGLDLVGRVEPESLLKRWGVRVLSARLPLSRNIDALAVWEGGAASVVVNAEGQHARWPSGRRATLAHEVCHLLFDAHHALPVAEALGGRMPRDLEQRARAFAAELLLPRSVVAAQFDGDALATVRRAAIRYGVSKELAAWQLRNSGVELEDAQRTALKGLVSRPQQF